MSSQSQLDDSVSHFHDSGNGDLTIDEAKTHFTAWALLKSPLVIVSGKHGDCRYLDELSITSLSRVRMYVI